MRISSSSTSSRRRIVDINTRLSGRRDARVAAFGVPRAHGGVDPRGRSGVRETSRAILRAEPRRPGAADIRPRRQRRHLPLRQVRVAYATTAGTETADPLEFLARVLVHIPDKGHVTTRYYGWYANRPRGMRRQAKPAAADAPVPIVTAPRLAPTEASRRWAALLQQHRCSRSSRATRSRAPDAPARCGSWRASRRPR